MESPIAFAKALLVGRPKATERLEHERLSKKLALAVFSSDALSSSAYATEEILLVLVAAGAAGLRYALPISIVITVVLFAVIFSYRQTVHAYPSGGGSYIVAHENLGKYPGLVAAAAILTDYVLTVAVSISAGIAAVVSAAPGLHRYRVLLALAVIALITLLNLRGVRESGRIFAVPTYAFITLVGTTILWGLVRYFLFGERAQGPPVEHGEHAVTLFLLLKAFSNGSTALTGVEAIADGVAAFKKPEARNAAITLTVMAAILAYLFVGLTALSRLYRVDGPTEHPHRTVVALIALTVFGHGPMFFAVQAATALILFLAANTAYADFPRLSAILARDRFAPRQMMNRGDRLAFSNGIIALGFFAGLLVIVYAAEVSRLIHLYVLGVFTAFTLSQLGMVVRWREHRDVEGRWKRYALVNGFGAAATFLVLCIVVVTKFLAGAWIVMAAIPLLVLWFNTTYRHYQTVAVLLRDPARRPLVGGRNHVVLLVGWPSQEERRALAYAQALRPHQLRTVHFSRPGEPPGVVAEWGRVLGPALSLELVPARHALAREVRDYVNRMRRRLDPSDFLTVVIPERVRPGPLGVLRGWQAFLVKASLLFTPGVIVTNVPLLEGKGRGARVPLETGARVRHVAILLVSAVHNATLQALEYARTLNADELHAVHVAIEPADAARTAREWEAWSPGLPLEILDSPYRSLVAPVQEYARSLLADGQTVVTIVIPEFIVTKWWHHLLHNQNAVQLKRVFLYEPDVVVTSVPYRLDPGPPPA